MKNLFSVSVSLLLAATSFSQVGVGTTTPNSTLDVRGSISASYRSFAGNTSAAITDNTLVFTGNSAATLTLPDATTMGGRYYWIKSASSNSSVLTIATTSSQTIDGAASWLVDAQNKVVRIVSNGSNWYVVSESLPGNAGLAWVQNGNAVGPTKSLGTTSNNDLPFITNNTEKMRINTAGNVGIGTSSFNGSNPEKLLVDAGNTSSFNVISGKGTIDNYLQLNIQNNSSGNNASSDLVATANNGNETVNYVDLGINSSTYNLASFNITGANDAYLYSTGNDFVIGNATSNKALKFFTGGTLTANERMRINGNGNVGIGLAAIPKAAVGAAKFAIEGTNSSVNGPHVQFTTAADNYPLMQIMPWNHDNVYQTYDAYYDGTAWKSSTSSGGNFVMGKEAGKFLWYYANVNSQGSAIAWSPGVALNNSGKVGIGTSTFDATNPEKLLVDAGITTSFNVISGKGTINNYLQLNIQNRSNGSSASSDVVATADNGNETVNFVDMGINSSTYTSTGILGGVNNAYLYATGNDFVIGNGTAAKDLVFFTGGTAAANEKMRLTAASVEPGTDNATTMGTTTKRWSVVYAANGTIQTSDARLKKNILPLTYGLNEIMKLEPVSYNWKDNSGGNKIGLIAQEVRKIIPQVVVGDESIENIGMNYAELVPVLINAVKELKTELDSTRKELAELKKLVNNK